MHTAWNPTLATGIPTVDNEHQEIFRQAALLQQAMKQGKGRQELAKIINFVDDYVVSHFAHEEKIMDQRRCPVADVNRQAHAKFIAKFKSLKEKFSAQGESAALVIDISTTINDWLVNHIKQIDSQLAQSASNASPAFAEATR